MKAFKGVSKKLGAFNQLDAGQGENELLGYGDGNGAHFDALFVEILKGIESSYAVDFATVWGQQHVKAERTGDSTTNFIAWVNECMK